MEEPQVEDLPSSWYEGRVNGHPTLHYRQNGPILVQTDCAWRRFESEDDAEHYLTEHSQ